MALKFYITYVKQTHMSQNILALSLLTLFLGALLIFLMIQLISPNILPDGLRLFKPAASSYVSSTPVVEDTVDEVVEPDTITEETQEGEIDFENPAPNMDSEILAMSSRPEMDQKSDRPDRIPDRIMGVMNGAALIYRSVQNSPPAEPPAPDDDQFNVPQRPL